MTPTEKTEVVTNCDQLEDLYYLIIQTMKVKELLEKLQKADKEAEVVFDDDCLKSVLFVEETTAKSEDGDIKFLILKYSNEN